MISHTVLTAMMPEHLLLLGIVLLIVMEIAGHWQRAAAAAAQETTRPHARRPGSRGAPHPEGSQTRLSESLRECCQSL